jgi:hypothetical protein
LPTLAVKYVFRPGRPPGAGRVFLASAITVHPEPAQFRLALQRAASTRTKRLGAAVHLELAEGCQMVPFAYTSRVNSTQVTALILRVQMEERSSGSPALAPSSNVSVASSPGDAPDENGIAAGIARLRGDIPCTVMEARMMLSEDDLSKVICRP